MKTKRNNNCSRQAQDLKTLFGMAGRASPVLVNDLFVVKLEKLTQNQIEELTKMSDREYEIEDNNNEAFDLQDIRTKFVDELDDFLSDDEMGKKRTRKNNNEKKSKKFKLEIAEKVEVKPEITDVKDKPKPVKNTEDDISDYEKIRAKNMAELRSKFLDQMKQMAKSMNPPKPVKPRKTVKRVIRRKVPKFRKIYGTRRKSTLKQK